jgi:hypothetical protein
VWRAIPGSYGDPLSRSMAQKTAVPWSAQNEEPRHGEIGRKKWRKKWYTTWNGNIDDHACVCSGFSFFNTLPRGIVY